jgi:hypothetical protein
MKQFKDKIEINANDEHVKRAEALYLKLAINYFYNKEMYNRCKGNHPCESYEHSLF